ncbi:MAG: hypothetical protein GOP50_12810 [Candidatus Heimdallarchaeota archaeon]|nr:hypothetical protein [Candidatus Heimdallarchaeota archaeon]
MSSREDILKSFIEKLLLIFPEIIAVYEFDKEITLFDKILEKREGLVIIISESDYSLENLLLIDLIYDKLQDEFGWEEGVRLANSFSRSYIRTKTNLWHINIRNNHCLLPEDQINLKNTRTLLYGSDVIPTIPFPHNETEILKINIGFTREDALDIFSNYKQYSPLVNPDSCWMRHDFVVDHSLVQILDQTLTQMKEGIQPEKNAHIYGRYGGSGKTQICYSLMKRCKDLSLPFIYRTEFWKGDDGKYIDVEFNPENSAESVTEWVVEKSPGENLVLFVDEIDIDIHVLKQKMESKYPKKEINLFIISGGKDISSFVDESFDVYDISKEFPFNESHLKELVTKLLEKSNINEEIFPAEIVNYIVAKTRLWNFSSIRTTPTAVILACSLSLAESIKIAMENEKKISISKEIAEKWSLLGTSPWYQKYNELHDVHAEYLVYNGEEYVDVDRHYLHPLP